jgi:hypothetical protein
LIRHVSLSKQQTPDKLTGYAVSSDNQPSLSRLLEQLRLHFLLSTPRWAAESAGRQQKDPYKLNKKEANQVDKG